MSTLGFFAGGGEMGARMRGHAWSSSLLGDPEGWVQPLKTTVELMLNSRQPMFVAWGPDLALLYNDGCIPICGRKHPDMLGRAFRAIWPEAWDDVEPLFKRALAGESVWFEDRRFVLERNGFSEEAWFSFSYSPVRESGRIAGVFCAVTETTQHVLERRRAAFKVELADELRLMTDESGIKARVAELLGRHLNASCAGYAAVDELGEHAEVEAEWTDGTVAGGAGRRHRLADYGLAYQARLHRGRVTRVNDALVDGLIASAPDGYASLQARAAVNAPIRRDGRMVSILYLLDAKRRRWTDEEVALIEEVAERTGSALERACAERVSAVRNRRIELLARIAGGLVLEGSSDDRLSAAFHAVAQEVGARYYFHYLIDDMNPGQMRLAASAGLTEAQREAFALIGLGDYLCGQVAANRRELVLEGVQHRGDEATASARALDVRAYAGFPLVAHGRLAGTIAFACTESPCFDAEKLGLMRTVADQTAAAIDRRRTEAAVYESETRFRNMADHAPVAMWVTDASGYCIHLNRAWYAYTGQTAEEAEGYGWLEATHPDDKAEAERMFRQANAERTAFRVEYRLRRHDGAYRWAIDAAAPRFSHTGEYLGYVGSVIDIDERREAEQRVRHSEGRYRAAIDAVQGILWTNDGAGRMVGEQAGWSALTGQSPAEYEGYGWASAVHPDDAASTVAAWNEAVAARRIFVFEHRVRRHDGQWRHYAIRAVPTLGDDGSILEWVGVHTDVTEQREVQRALLDFNAQLERRVRDATAAERARLDELVEARGQLHELQKMETIGQLTGGIAHDFNNLLAPIVGCLEILRRKMPADERLQRVISGAQRSADRARTLISRLLLFARREHLEPRAVDTIDLMAGLEDLIARSIGPQIDLSLVVAPDAPTLYVDPQQLELAILNLVVNARDAMPDGGALRIAVCGADASQADKGLRLAPGAYVRLDVADSGTGMDAETLRRAVEPFFTTKDVGKGTGLGLSMAHGLAYQSGGALAISSVPGHGTTASLWLPVTGDSAPVGPRSDDKAITPCPALTVALVDDQELVRHATAELLTDLGHRVRQFSSGHDALDALRHDRDVDLLITDYMMPGMTGAALARQLRQLRPELPAFLITGYAALSEEEASGLPRLDKPFRQADLSAMVAAAVSAKSPRRQLHG